MSSSLLRVALAQYQPLPHATLSEWRDHVTTWVKDAVSVRAQLLVFPEYFSTDIAVASGFSRGSANDLMVSMQKYREEFLSTFSELARVHGVYIAAGTFPWNDEGKYFNRAFFFGPTGNVGHQDKIMLTRFEREKTFIVAGDCFSLFETSFGLVGIPICFDIQFPLPVHKLAKAGCSLLIVPSCTGSFAGNNRVNVGCQARALENQIAVIQSPTVGEATWQPIADVSHGFAAAFGPPDNGFPEDGILAKGQPDRVGWVSADVNFDSYANVRADGHVLNWQYWDEQEDKLNFTLELQKL